MSASARQQSWLHEERSDGSGRISAARYENHVKVYASGENGSKIKIKVRRTRDEVVTRGVPCAPQGTTTEGRKLKDARGSRWKSDRCSTLTRCPLGFFGDGSGSGFGLENQLVRFKGGVGRNGHEIDGRFRHNI
jgi:hypothetical protein